jgi:hypothetical protein
MMTERLSTLICIFQSFQSQLHVITAGRAWIVREIDGLGTLVSASYWQCSEGNVSEIYTVILVGLQNLTIFVYKY